MLPNRAAIWRTGSRLRLRYILLGLSLDWHEMCHHLPLSFIPDAPTALSPRGRASPLARAIWAGRYSLTTARAASCSCTRSGLFASPIASILSFRRLLHGKEIDASLVSGVHTAFSSFLHSASITRMIESLHASCCLRATFRSSRSLSCRPMVQASANSCAS